MEFTFEVRESDLMGRIGRLRVGGKALDTPCLLPVIHPVNQLVTTQELELMGFKGLMTNSYIILSRRRDEALKEGIHRMLQYEGVFMTDSGGYQVLEYGDIEVGYRRVASFQESIGSELSVTLDKPTGFSASEKYARSSMEYSLKNAIATINEYGQGKTAWVGPIQGGLFPLLLSKSASSLVKAGFEFLALGSPVEVMKNYKFLELLSMVATTRRAIPYSVPLHLFGAGHPLTMALAVALGCDTFDSASYMLFAKDGRFMTDRGVSRLEAMKFLPCSCPICAKTTVAGLLELDLTNRTRSLALHNLYVLRKEVEVCREAIAEGRLWDLVQEKAIVHPRLFDAFKRLSKATDLLLDGTPLLKDKGLFVRDRHDFARPELARASNRLKQSVMRRSNSAVLVISEVPLPLSKVRLPDHKLPSECDFYGLHPTLGPYPAELEFVYPFTQTVASSGACGKAQTAAAQKQLRNWGYSEVLLVKVDARQKDVQRGT
jgi:7-cyano-7-deazaguanine tRNA-ribosyltransferase